MQLEKNTSEFQKRVQWAMDCTALEFSDKVVTDTNEDILQIFARIERNETTRQQEETKLLNQWNELINKKVVTK